MNLQTVLHSRTASFGQMNCKTMNNMFEKFDITVMTFQKHCTILASLVILETNTLIIARTNVKNRYAVRTCCKPFEHMSIVDRADKA